MDGEDSGVCARGRTAEGPYCDRLLKARKASGWGLQRAERPSCGVDHGGGSEGVRE